MDKKWLIDCCQMCEEYCGKEHDYNECKGCPVIKLYQKCKRLENRCSELELAASYDRENAWIERDRRGYEMGEL